MGNLQADMRERYVKHDELNAFRQRLQEEKFQMYENQLKEHQNTLHTHTIRLDTYD